MRYALALFLLAPPGAAAGASVKLDAGGGHTCAVKVSGKVACWGRGEEGQTDVPPGL